MGSTEQQSVSSSIQCPTTSASQKRPVPRGTAAYPRKRAVTACQVCRARRTKCDNAKPACSFCVKTGATCVQSPGDLSSFDPASLQILQRLDDLERLVRDIGSTDSPNRGIAESVPPQERLERSQLLPCSIELILDWDSLKNLRGQCQLSSPAFPCTDKTIVEVTTSPPLSGLEDFEPHRIRTLLDNFFSYVHVKNPVLNEQQTRRTVNRVCLHGIDWSPDACLSLLICALGTIATPLNAGYVHRDSETYLTAQSFFLAAKKRLGLVLGTSSLIEAQCMFFAGVYSMCTFERLPAWRYFMQSLACCQTFQSLIAFRQEYGEQLDDEGRRIAAAEQAIYWSAWKSEREVNDDLNLPGFLFAEIDIAGYPPFFPTPPTQRSEIPRGIDAETATREQTSWYFYLSEISLLRLWRRMAKEIIDFTPDDGQSHISGLAHAAIGRESQISDWINALPEHMSTLNPPEEDEVGQFILRGHLINVWEILYWPFVDWAVRPALRTENDILVTQLANKGLQIHVDRIRVNRPGFSHRHHGTFGMIKACSRSAIILLAAGARSFSIVAPEDEGHFHMPWGWQEAVEDVIRLLETWETESADLSNMSSTLRLLFQNWRASFEATQ